MVIYFGFSFRGDQFSKAPTHTHIHEYTHTHTPTHTHSHYRLFRYIAYTNFVISYFTISLRIGSETGWCRRTDARARLRLYRSIYAMCGVYVCVRDFIFHVENFHRYFDRAVVAFVFPSIQFSKQSARYPPIHTPPPPPPPLSPSPPRTDGYIYWAGMVWGWCSHKNRAGGMGKLGTSEEGV